MKIEYKAVKRGPSGRTGFCPAIKLKLSGRDFKFTLPESKEIIEKFKSEYFKFKRLEMAETTNLKCGFAFSFGEVEIWFTREEAKKTLIRFQSHINEFEIYSLLDKAEKFHYRDTSHLRSYTA